MKDIRIGSGYDVHQLVEGRKLIMGGVEIPYEKGLLGHSDADVVLHAIGDALLGSLALGDLGKHFPDTDASYKGADSKKLLGHIYALVKSKGYVLGNLDVMVIAQKPKLAPYIDEMRRITASILETGEDRISIKATTTEKLGFTGRGEGIAAQASVLVYSIQ
ncbi:MAG: 2-C-methyl-D-erythritol 2,4-cyclodiphosphate synthase [Fibrobacteres bacterium]|nr:2-C-methyl-D-erythritol 2,4-cyclodiphosphate synthase [Fibrobacterota bacterium]